VALTLWRRLSRPLGLLALLVLVGAAGYVGLLGSSWLDGVYMTLITISTVGYGEVVPGLHDSVPGRLLTMLLILSGTGLLMYSMSLVTAFLVEGELHDLLRGRRMKRRIDDLKDHVILCGLGVTGHDAAEELIATGTPFVAIERDPSHLASWRGRDDVLYIEGDATDDDVLRSAGLDRARGLITSLPEDKDNLFVCFTARQANPRLRIVARCMDSRHRERLQVAGADAVVLLGRIGALRLVSEMVRPRVVSFLDGMLRPGRQQTWRFEEVDVPAGAPAAGRSLGELRIPERFGMPVLAVTGGEGRSVEYHPPADRVIRPGEALVFLTDAERMQRLRRELAGA